MYYISNLYIASTNPIRAEVNFFMGVMLEMRPKSPPEMEKLLMKYRSGSVPPLVAKDDGNDYGLLNEDLLDIFEKGFSAAYSIPLRISVVLEDSLSEEDGSGAFYHKLNPFLSPCKYFQSIQKSNVEQQKQAFAANSRKLNLNYCSVTPELITRNGKAKAYICSAGMISFAVPVYVAGEIVAILSSECKKPGAGVIWPERLIKQSIHHLLDVDEPSSDTKIDLWQEGKRRIRKCEDQFGLKPGELLTEVTEHTEINPEFEVFPETLQTIMDALENAGTHLSELADKTYRLEKESVISWLRAEMASALSSVDTFWGEIQLCFSDLARLLGADYILLISRDKSHASSFHLQCQYGLPEESLPVVQYDWTGSTTRVDDFTENIGTFDSVQEMDLKQYRDVPILGTLYSLYGKGVSYPVLVASTITLDGGLTLMVLGRKKLVTGQRAIIAQDEEGKSAGPIMGWLRQDDRQHLMIIVRELAIITSVFFSMKALQETVKEQTNLMESVAHDLKTPIQNIMIAAENLREGRVDPERASRTIAGVVTQLQRLDMLAQKTWMLERIRLDKLEYNDEQAVNLYQIFLECRELLIDMAERISIDMHIDTDIEHWRDIHVDVEMFRLVALNLLHNGIKYSFPNTCVKIGGWQDDMGVSTSITIENEGIRIHDEEKDRIFERYFRSKKAIQMDPAGSGIGLVLVKEFVDHYDGKIDVRSTEVGFGKYSNVFSLFLPGR